MSNQREYRYIGPQALLSNLPTNSRRVLVSSADDVLRWIAETSQLPEYNDLIVATFIVDTQGKLWINDRRSEHVLCAAGGPVLSAGEIGFAVAGVEVIEISNQSTGYCPEPESWWAVERALDEANIIHPPHFTLRCVFRLCNHCGTKNIVKDNWFECEVCQQPLSAVWNFE